MRVKELRSKSKAELKRLLAESQEKLSKLRFGIANKQLKDVREIRSTKRTIARVLTILSQNVKAQISNVKSNPKSK